MIKATELRVGNKLNFHLIPGQNAQIVTIAWVGDDSIGYQEQHEASYPQTQQSFSGIPLTPEWLERCGFQLSEYFARLGNFTLKQTYDGYVPVSERFAVGVEIKYLHQLQNLFLCLVGEELTIKPPPRTKITSFLSTISEITVTLVHELQFLLSGLPR